MTGPPPRTDALADLAALEAGLRTARVGHPLHVLATVTSTNDVARKMAEGGAGEGAAVLALEQSAGRGRLGRSWVSPPGGVYLSVVLRPRLPVARWPLLALALAVGAAEGIESAVAGEATAGAGTAAGAPVRLKWPNDLLVNGRKVGGILLDAGAGFAIAGIGINTRASSGALPEGGDGVDAAPAPLARGVIERLEPAIDAAYRDPAGTIREWKSRTITLGRVIRVTGAQVIEGQAEDIDEDGALIVRTSSGVRRVLAGDVSLR